MDKDYLKGLKQGLGFLTIFLIVFSAYAAGFHQTSEIVPGIFQGDFTFDGNVKINDSLVVNSSINASKISSSTNVLVNSSVDMNDNLLDNVIVDGKIPPNSRDISHPLAHINNDFLWADKEKGFTITSSEPVDGGKLLNLFRTQGSAYWGVSTTSFPLNITINGVNNDYGWDTALLYSRNGKLFDYVRVEAYDGSSWQVISEKNGSDTNQEMWVDLAYSYEKYKFVIDKPKSSSLKLDGIAGYQQTTGIKNTGGYLSRNGGDLYDDVDMNDNQVKNATNTFDVIYEEDFDGDSATSHGWSIDTAICGSDENGVFSQMQDCAGDTGAVCPILARQDNLLQVTGDDVHKSPSFDTSEYNFVKVKFYHASESMDSSSENGAFDWYDGSSWRRIYTSHNNPTSGQYPNYYTVDIEADLLNSNTKLKIYNTGGNGCGDNSAIDEIKVLGMK